MPKHSQWISFIFSICFICFALSVKADEKVIEGSISQDEPRIIKSAITKDRYKNMDVQAIDVNFYYYPEAEVNYELLKREGQKQYPHLLGYREIDGLYRKAITETTFEEELKVWRYQGGPRPYYLKAGAKIRNNGNGAMTDVKVTFTFEVKVATLRAKGSTMTTDYSNLSRNARWQKWFTKTINVKMLPPGEYRIIYTEDISLCSLLETLKDKWPEYLRVKVNVYSPLDDLKNNNFASKSIQMIPDHFILRVLH